jgi:hypothetical protein
MSQPLYPRLLRLRNVHPSAWQRAVLGEGMAALGVLLSLADLASAWSILVLPVAMAVVVKAHDVITGLLPERGPSAVAERAGSEELWALLEEGKRRAEPGAAPFALVEDGDGVEQVVPPQLATEVLTADELAGALRAGLTVAAPARAVLVYEGRDGIELAGYEAGLATGLLVAASMTVLTSKLPTIYQDRDSEKAPTP